MAIITLTSDFGRDSTYVAVMKGVMLSIDPAARIVDVTHGVPPQDVRAGALVLADACRWFPPETIHLAVVDPGVGTERALIYARIGSQQFLAPDNGLLSRLALRSRPSTIIALTNGEYWLPRVSATFHGRDILAPVAAHLSLGLAPEQLGPPHPSLVELTWEEPRVTAGKIEGKVQAVDSFGNLITDITAEMLAGVPSGEQTVIACDDHETLGLFRTYADQPAMTLIALVGSSGYLELAIVGDSAAAMLGVRVGTPVTVKW